MTTATIVATGLLTQHYSTVNKLLAEKAAAGITRQDIMTAAGVSRPLSDKLIEEMKLVLVARDRRLEFFGAPGSTELAAAKPRAKKETPAVTEEKPPTPAATDTPAAPVAAPAVAAAAPAGDNMAAVATQLTAAPASSPVATPATADAASADGFRDPSGPKKRAGRKSNAQKAAEAAASAVTVGAAVTAPAAVASAAVATKDEDSFDKAERENVASELKSLSTMLSETTKKMSAHWEAFLKTKAESEAISGRMGVLGAKQLGLI